VVDAPGGGGKIPVAPNYVLSQAPGRWILRNYEGFISSYTEASYKEQDTAEYRDLAKEERRSTDGIMKLVRGEAISIGPEESKRNKRKL
jgi:lysine 2,3-aminomutase